MNFQLEKLPFLKPKSAMKEKRTEFKIALTGYDKVLRMKQMFGRVEKDCLTIPKNPTGDLLA